MKNFSINKYRRLNTSASRRYDACVYILIGLHASAEICLCTDLNHTELFYYHFLDTVTEEIINTTRSETDIMTRAKLTRYQMQIIVISL